jgi:hypothetical protein
LLASRFGPGQRGNSMMSQSDAALAASSGFVAVVRVVLWVALSSACSGASPDRGGLGNAGDDSEAGAGNSQSDGDTDSASADEGPGGPSYMGKPIADPERDASGSIASPDGSCPIPDTLEEYGAMCSSCAQSHCSSALSECDPTMVNACTEYYCPTQCPQPETDSGVTTNPCPKIVQCCTSLFGTPLGLQCIGIQATSAQATCQSLLTQAQALGRCE